MLFPPAGAATGSAATAAAAASGGSPERATLCTHFIETLSDAEVGRLLLLAGVWLFWLASHP